MSLLTPGQRVAVFQDEQASGATLGYYGTVVAAHTNGTYRVFVPFYSRTIEVCGADLIAAGPGVLKEGVTQAVDRLEIRFECELLPDNRELKGTFRRKGGPWHFFHFKRSDRMTPSYEFRLRVSPPSAEGALTYSVPKSCYLSRGYAVAALAEFAGTEGDTANAPARTSTPPPYPGRA
jgi:hypothetical protein